MKNQNEKSRSKPFEEIKQSKKFAVPYSRFLVEAALFLRGNPDIQMEDVRFKGHKKLLDIAHKIINFRALRMEDFKRLIFDDARAIIENENAPLNILLGLQLDGGNGLSFLDLAGDRIFKLKYMKG